MPIELAYQIIKDLVALAKMKEVDPINLGRADIKELIAMGVLDGEPAHYSWCAPRNLFSKTQASGASQEIVWVTDKLRRTKRQVVRSAVGGAPGLVLIRKKEA